MLEDSLKGITVIEMAGLGPVPFAGMLLAELGAEILLIEPPGEPTIIDPKFDPTREHKQSFNLDVKNPDELHQLLARISEADVLIEGYRPGVMERLGLSPETCLKKNSQLIYARMTGWGQKGTLMHTAGHDINYIAVAGALAAFKRHGDKPYAPLNLVGDYAAGSLFLIKDILAALIARSRTGQGQVLDIAIVDGTIKLMTLFYGLHKQGLWSLKSGTNILDGGAPYYDVYETSDAKYMAVGAIEPQFYQELLSRLELVNHPLFEQQNDQIQWPAMRKALSEIFLQQSQEVWIAVFAGSDACVSPVLDMYEAKDFLSRNR